MKYIVMLALTLVASQAKADGFVCETTEGDLTVKVYNHTQANDGTRNGAIMVLSNPSADAGSRTLATFTDVKSILSNHGADYSADVDLRFHGARRDDALVAGTQLRELDTIELNVDFSYNQPVVAGEHVAGDLVLVKREGGKETLSVDCTRYLKN
jgi:hypothetical protein